MWPTYGTGWSRRTEGNLYQPHSLELLHLTYCTYRAHTVRVLLHYTHYTYCTEGNLLFLGLAYFLYNKTKALQAPAQPAAGAAQAQSVD